MAQHIHVGLLEFARFLAYLLIAGFFIRLAEAKLSDNAAGKGLAFIY